MLEVAPHLFLFHKAKKLKPKRKTAAADECSYIAIIYLFFTPVSAYSIENYSSLVLFLSL
jgi:hypothetical protein